MVKMVQNAHEMVILVKNRWPSMARFGQKVENLQNWLEKKDFKILTKFLGGYRTFLIQR